MSVASEASTSFSLVSGRASEVSEHDSASQVGEVPIAPVSEKMNFSGTPTRRTVFLIGVLLGAVLSATSEVPVYVCDNGWSYFDENGKCYKRFPAAGFYEAHYKCQQMKAHLTSVENSAENRFLTDLANGKEHVWIGFHGPHGSGNRGQWIDGTPINFYAEWYSHEGRCTSLVGDRKHYSKGDWVPKPCTTAYDFICAKPSTRLTANLDRLIEALKLILLASIIAGSVFFFRFTMFQQ